MTIISATFKVRSSPAELQDASTRQKTSEASAVALVAKAMKAPQCGGKMDSKVCVCVCMCIYIYIYICTYIS